MEIKGTNQAQEVGGIIGKAESKKEKALAKNRQELRGDSADFKVALSDKSQSLRKSQAKAMGLAQSTDDVRAERVKQLKEQIKNGDYKVDAGKVADGILVEAIKDHIASTF